MIDSQLSTFREIDTVLGLTKGSAFRAFKQILVSLEEGTDFICLDNQKDSAQIEILRSQKRIYRSSIQVVLLTPSGRKLVLHHLKQPL